MSALSREEAQRVAALARLELTSEEIDLFTRQLTDILNYVEQIRNLDTSGVPPTSHVMNQPMDRHDEPHASLPREEALANAPEAAALGGLFKVPRVFG